MKKDIELTYTVKNDDYDFCIQYDVGANFFWVNTHRDCIQLPLERLELILTDIQNELAKHKATR